LQTPQEVTLKKQKIRSNLRITRADLSYNPGLWRYGHITIAIFF